MLDIIKFTLMSLSLAVLGTVGTELQIASDCHNYGMAKHTLIANISCPAGNISSSIPSTSNVPKEAIPYEIVPYRSHKSNKTPPTISL